MPFVASDLEAAYWDKLVASPFWPSAIDAATNLFRGYDGRVLPFNTADGVFPESAVPGMSGEATRIGDEPQEDGVTVEGQVVLRCALVWDNRDEQGRRPMDEAMGGLIGWHRSAEARRPAWSSILSDVRFEDESLTWIRDENDTRVLYWLWTYEVTLVGATRPIGE